MIGRKSSGGRKILKIVFILYAMIIKESRMRCLITPLEAENVKLAQDGLDFELRKKFKGMTFLYLYELSEKGN